MDEVGDGTRQRMDDFALRIVDGVEDVNLDMAEHDDDTDQKEAGDTGDATEDQELRSEIPNGGIEKENTGHRRFCRYIDSLASDPDAVPFGKRFCTPR